MIAFTNLYVGAGLGPARTGCPCPTAGVGGDEGSPEPSWWFAKARSWSEFVDIEASTSITAAAAGGGRQER